MKRVKENDTILKGYYQRYPWLQYQNTIKEYIEPHYYDRLLKDYIFEGRLDIEIFADFLKRQNLNGSFKALELGSGSGRATEVMLREFKKKKINLDMVDLSERMLRYSKKKFKNFNNICYFKEDAINFLEKSDEIYDMIFSLWSFSHSVHQVLTKMGLKNGTERIVKVLHKMIHKNMRKGSNFFLIHFDSLSEEQRILIQQWKKVFPIFKNNKVQSPSQLIIDRTFSALDNQNIIYLKKRHYIGQEIEYDSISEALEIYFNFHMESYFNESKLLPEIMNELIQTFQKFTRKDGKVAIKPGCYIYEFIKN